MKHNSFAFFLITGWMVSLAAGCSILPSRQSISHPSAPPGHAPISSLEMQTQFPSAGALKSELTMPDHYSIDAWVRCFTEKNHNSFQTQLDRACHYVVPAQEIFVRKGLPKDLVYVALIESGFSPTAESHANAVGMWQIISKTGSRFGLEQNQWLDERRHPMKAAQAAADYLSFLFDTFGSWPLALAAYNAGEKTIQKSIDRSGVRDFWALRENGKLPAETRDYVPKVYAAVKVIRNCSQYGFRFNPDYYLVRHETVPVPGGVKLSWIGKQIGVPEDSLVNCNPELCKPVTPPGCSDYELCVPLGKGEDVLAALTNCPPQKITSEKPLAAPSPPAAVVYRVKRGDSWSGLAAKYGCPANMLAALNGMKTSRPLKAGQSLKLPAWKSSTSVPVAKANRGKENIIASIPDKKKRSGGEQKRISYVVREGDTLWMIAGKFHIPVKTLCTQNNLKPNQKLRPGNLLLINADWQELSRMAKRKY